MENWRLFWDQDHAGAWNMAVDEALLLAHARRLSPPTLRFYGWKPSCLSLGRLQKQLPEAVLSVQRAHQTTNQTTKPRDLDDEFDVVRRPTGGRAVWHAREITYCVVVREELLPAHCRSVEGAYRWLSEGFLLGLRQLGLPVEMAPSGARSNGSNCFAASAGCDFLANGKKLIGAAQCRKDGAVLQHGSLLLSIEEEKWRHFAGGPMDYATSLQALGVSATQPQVIEALGEGFARSLRESGTKTPWLRAALSQKELALAQLLNNEKYSRDCWNFEAQIELSSERQIRTLLENALM